MSRSLRVILTMLVVLTSIGMVGLFIWLGSASEGPIGTSIGKLGGAFSQMESELAHRIRAAPRRADSLSWLGPMRIDPDSLRTPGRLLLGVHDDGLPHSLEGALEVEEALQTSLPLIHLYTAWGDRADQRFPLRPLRAIQDLGSIPVVTWEPWLVDFENTLHPHLPLRDDRDAGGLASIAQGEYDFYIDDWARQAADYGGPLLVRFAHEMNDPYRYPWGPQNNQPQDFVVAWRHVVERFQAAGAQNVVWVWAPHVAYEGYDAYYPGDDVTDWVGTGALNYGTVAHWSRWWSFQEIFGNHYPQLEVYGKPIMIAEFGSLGVGGDRAAWLHEALEDLPRRFPALKALVFFHVEADQTVTLQVLDWAFVQDSVSVASIQKAIDSW
ncbi:MAG: glycosyl hydrolase [Gemmatimonadota bacterium]